MNTDDKTQDISLSTIVAPEYGLNPDFVNEYFWVFYDPLIQSWDFLPTTFEEDLLNTRIEADLLHTDPFLILSIVRSVDYHYYIEEMSEADEAEKLTPTSTILSPLLTILAICVVVVFAVVLTRQGYRSYLMNRNMPIFTHPHRLTMEQVLENQTRSKIIDFILEYPGMHFNELLRATEISAGHLAWHLDILETYKIITKQRVGQYLTYYAFLHDNPLSKLDLKLQKSQTTLEILQLIRENPGIYQNDIAKRVGLKHNTLKYHLDKLQEAQVIRKEQRGRKQLFFVEAGLVIE
jgi:DNA-binding transcriptional ArsR family regulator